MAGTILNHPFAHGSRGVGHDADDGVVLTGQLLNAGNGQARRHAAQDEPARPLGQRELQRGQQGLHHLRLDSEEDEVAPACHLVVDRGIAAQFGSQLLRLGSGAVGQIHVLRVCCFAHRAGNGPAHVAAA